MSTNAGGLRLIRFGSLRASVLGIEAVMADGTVLDSLKTLRKDNTGYDIKQLFIGSEGTLGVITKVAISVPRKLESVHLAMVGCNNFQQVLEAVAAAKFKLAEIVSAIEFFDQQCSDLVVRNLPGMSNVLESSSPFWVLIETTGSEDSHDSVILPLVSSFQPLTSQRGTGKAVQLSKLLHGEKGRGGGHCCGGRDANPKAVGYERKHSHGTLERRRGV